MNTYVMYTDLVVSVSTMFQVQVIECLIKGGLNYGGDFSYITSSEIDNARLTQ